MIKIKLDFARCDANGTCAMLMPDVFEIGTDGTLQLLKTEIDDGREGELDEAILCCPMGAIACEKIAAPANEDALPKFEPFSDEAKLHAGGAIGGKPLAIGTAGYTVLDYQLAMKVLRDTRFSNSALRLMEDFGITDGPVHEFRERSLLIAEGPRHIRLRTPLARFMGPTTVEAIRGVLREILIELTENLSGKTSFNETVSELIPARVYCYLAGAPKSDAARVASLSERTLSLLTRDRSLAPMIRAAYDELWDYLNTLIDTKKTSSLGDDMLSFLIKEQQAGKLSQDELRDEATAMLEASSVNTSHQTGLTVWALLRNREVWTRLREDHALIGAAVLEALRLYPRPGIVSKFATEDIDLDGTVIPKDADVHIAIWSANRDPKRFDHPEKFDLDREQNHSLTFSTGPHGCLGQSLARVEIEEVIRHLLIHYPSSTVIDEETDIKQAGGRWMVNALVIDLKK